MRLKGRQKLVPFAFISPWIVGFVLFVLFPLMFSMYMSVFDWNIIGGRQYVGFGNYTALFRDDNFSIALDVSMKYTGLLVPINVGIALLLALLLNAVKRGSGVFKTIFYLPGIISGVALALIWSWILKDQGILNYMLSQLHIPAVPWLRSPNSALWAVVLTTLWAQGAMMMVFLSGLKAIPTHVSEAALIDGATGWRKLWRITLPLLSPTVVYNLIMAIIASFQQLTVVINLTNGGPRKSTYLYSLFIYENAFKKFQLGYAAASAWIMFLVVLALTGLVLLLSRKWTYYEV